MLNLLRYFERKCVENPNITVVLGNAPDPECLEKEAFDAVIAATGSKPIVPSIPGVECARPATWAFGHEDEIDQHVVIVGGGEVGVETALHLSQKGKNVTVLEMKDIAAAEAKRGHYYNMFMDAVREYGDNLKILLQVVCTGIFADGVTYKDSDGSEHTLAAGTVLLATGFRADVSGAEKYMNCGKQFYIIGDCAQMGNLQTAIRSAWSIANTI